jgi:predicted GTPase
VVLDLLGRACPAAREAVEAWSLGMGEPLPVSAISGFGIRDMLDKIVAMLPDDENDRGHGLLFEYCNPLAEWVDDALSAVIERGAVEELKGEYLVADPDLPMITE